MAGRRGKGPLLLLVLALAGGAFWFLDGLVLVRPYLEPYLGDWLGDGGARPVRAADRPRDAAGRGPDEVLPPAPRTSQRVTDEPEPQPDPAVDALFRYGSWDGSRELRHVFLPSAAPPQDAVPEGRDESGGEDLGDAAQGGPPGVRSPVAQGEPPPVEAVAPPEHEVSVVLISHDEKLAVVDGAVVTIGDQLAAGEIVAIRDEGLLVRGARGLVEYVIGSARPQEHRGASASAFEERP